VIVVINKTKKTNVCSLSGNRRKMGLKDMPNDISDVNRGKRMEMNKKTKSEFAGFVVICELLGCASSIWRWGYHSLGELN